ncbi:hypothetical protein [Pseudomonas sp. C2B4]|uniref:hypothetical protein n=1 Tax=Pseudomonas sp. C2B4 TaxID=2735270 RepID=UPI001585E6C6|nr:hypothetical protein [Pseudomonas sp. C2B4]NUU34649.1 hypothetical protein [Pseudomonas sp. C2B4]
MLGTQGATPEKELQIMAIGQGEFNSIRKLTAEETAAYRKAHEHLHSHDEAASLTEIARRNLVAFEECVKDLCQVVPGRGQHRTLSREAKLDVNRHFLNFLSAVRQLLDHTELRLKRQYSNNPEIFKVFQKRTSTAFDTVFAYRFLYKLRNYSQHCGAPIGIVEYESKSHGNAGETKHTLHLFFDANELLRVGGDLWGPVKTDLKKIDSKFPVDTLARKVMTELEAIWEAVRNAERPHLKTSAEIALETVKEACKPHLSPAVVRFWHRKKSTTIEIINPPIETMAWLGDHTFKEIL